MGREFHDPLHSSPIVSAPAKLSVLDANGSLLQTVDVTLDARNAGREVSACQKMPLPEVMSYVLLTAIRSIAAVFAWQTTSSHISRLV
ncbi:alpha-2-macroglobulin family protein [Escherichia coli]|nr:alpha-2-macroglobulin family protein [Escherichia coli]